MLITKHLDAGRVPKIDLAVRGALWFGPLKGAGKTATAGLKGGLKDGLSARGQQMKGQLVDVLVAKGKIVALVPAGTLDMHAAKEVDAAGLVLLRSMFLRVFRGRTHTPAAEGAPNLDDIGAGKLALVTRAVGPGLSGEIKFRGSFWRAESAETIGEGESVVILGLAQNDSGAYLVRSASAAAQNGGQ